MGRSRSYDAIIAGTLAIRLDELSVQPYQSLVPLLDLLAVTEVFYTQPVICMTVLSIAAYSWRYTKERAGTDSRGWPDTAKEQPVIIVLYICLARTRP